MPLWVEEPPKQQSTRDGPGGDSEAVFELMIRWLVIRQSRFERG